MKPAGLLRYWYWANLSQPAAERTIYAEIRRRRLRSIVEIGVGDARRTERMIAVALMRRPGEELRYTGIDLFEARPADHPGVTLKKLHRLLAPVVGKLQLAPGDPFSSLARIANSHANTDLVVIAADQQGESLARAWTYLPRMLHAESLVLVEEAAAERPHFRVLRPLDVQRLVVTERPARHAA